MAPSANAVSNRFRVGHRPVGIVLPIVITLAATTLFHVLDVRDSSVATVEPALFIGVAFATIMAAHRLSVKQIAARIGLSSRAREGLQFASVAAMPMIIVLAIAPATSIRGMQLVTEGICGPVAEEILFRGFLLTELRLWGGLSAGPAVVFGAAVFGFAHAPGAPFVMLQAALGGVVFGWLRERMGTLWPAIGLHSLINVAWSAFNLRSGQSAALEFSQAITLGLAVLLSLGWDHRSARSGGLSHSHDAKAS